jgi:hypothetical protein
VAKPEELPGTAEPEGQPPETTPLRKSRGIWISLAMALVAPLLLSIMFIGAMAVAVHSAGDRQQTEVMDAHDTALLYLTNCKGHVAETAQLTFDQKQGVNDELTRVVAGDYGVAAELRSQDIVRVLQVPSKVDRIKLMLTLSVCQDRFLSKQQELSNMVTEFRLWLQSDWMTEHLGANDYPNGSLKLPAGDRCVHGNEALSLLIRPVAQFTIDTQWESKDPYRKACREQQ